MESTSGSDDAQTLEEIERKIVDTSRKLAQMMAQLVCANPFDKEALEQFQKILIAPAQGKKEGSEEQEDAEQVLNRMIEMQGKRVEMLKRYKKILLEKMFK